MKKAKNLTKQIICIIIVLMLCNFIIPNYSYAVDTGEGGSLIKVITQFLCFIPDAVIDLLQDMFVSPERIELEDGSYSIKYSPGVIFSGQVPALDIDFIHPGESKSVTIIRKDYTSVIDALDFNGAKKIYEKQYAGVGVKYLFTTKNGVIRDIRKDKKYGYDETREIDLKILEGKLKSVETENSSILFGGSTWDSEANSMELAWYNEDQNKVYVIVDYFKIEQYMDPNGYTSNTNVGIIYLYEMDADTDLGDVTGMVGEDGVPYTKTYNSSSAILQSVVATWYNALRRIALVGLLSAIIYIGIRILLTTTSAKDKAKYKKMLKDWIIAVCLLFTLHYIMSITITVVDKINEVIQTSSIAANGEDILMTSVRNKIYNGENWSVVLSYVVIYFVLAVYTIIYTVQYIRRLIYIAFLTTIAPLITLTYPLDKIKDSKAQAFDMWIKDYIFFSLIQVVHLLIYYVFLGSAMDLAAEGNWIYAIVAIGFITPAEKLIKKMFGFEKSKTLGEMGAGATGALIMNAIQKIPQGSSKGGSSSKESSSGKENANLVRTAGVNPFASSSENSSLSASSSSDSSANGGNSGINSNNTKNPETEKEPASRLAKILKSKNFKENSSQTSAMLKLSRPKRNVANGVKAVAGKYFAPVANGTIRLMAGTTGAIIGASAMIAQGDLGKVGTGLIVGASSGKGVANIAREGVKKVVQIPEKINDVVDTIREGTHGKEVAQNAKFDRVFKNSKDYQSLKDSSGFSDTEFDKKVQKMLDSGIKDSKQMKKILKNHRKDPKKYNMEKAIQFSQLAEKCSEDILYDKDKFIRFCQERNLSISEEELAELRKNIIIFK